MGLMSFLKKQFLDVIEMGEIDGDTLYVKYPMADQEIQNGATLVVRESQFAVFVNEGKLADIFTPGTHKLTTQTLPVLTNLRNWDKLFSSPFKSDVYFINSKLMLNTGWGTQQPITVRDKDFGMIRIRAFGKFTYKVNNPKKFFQNVTGASDRFERSEIESQLKNLIVTTFASSLGNSKVPFLDLAADQVKMSDLIKTEVSDAFDNYGLQINDFTIESLNLPEELQKAVDERSAMNIAGNLNDYTKYQMAKSIPLAAQTEGGVAGLGASMVMGMNMASTMQDAMKSKQETPAEYGKLSEDELEEKLLRVKRLFEKDLISKEEHDDLTEKIKAALISKII